jgi:hypothetical protein
MKNKFGPREPDMVFVQNLDTPYGTEWDTEAIRGMREYLKSMPVRISGEGADPKFAAAIDQALDEYISNRGAPPVMMGPERGDTFRVGLQDLMDEIRKGKVPQNPWFIPADMDRLLRRAQAIIKENED